MARRELLCQMYGQRAHCPYSCTGFVDDTSKTAKFQVLAAVSLSILFFCNVTLCPWASGSRRFVGSIFFFSKANQFMTVVAWRRRRHDPSKSPETPSDRPSRRTRFEFAGIRL